MTIAVITLTHRAETLGARICTALPEATLYAKEPQLSESVRFDTSIAALVKEIFHTYDALICIMACGIVVRTIAPHIHSKRSDPAILVLDETGTHVISLLSGHIGGANELAKQVAHISGGTPVITTASDVQGKLAVDQIAERLGCTITDYTQATRVTAHIVQGRPVALRGLHPATVPGYLAAPEDQAAGRIVISPYTQPHGENTVHLVPRTIVAGIGFRRNVPSAEIREALVQTLEKLSIEQAALACIATIDIKRDDAALHDAAQMLGVPVAYYSAQELATVEEEYERSSFVEQSVGVPAVSATCAMLCGDARGTMRVEKAVCKRVTVSLWENPLQGTLDTDETRETE